MEKSTPHCKLATIKALVESRKVQTTHAARVWVRMPWGSTLPVSFKEL